MKKCFLGTGRETPPPLFDLKIVYSYVVEVADSESDLGLHGRALVSEIICILPPSEICKRSTRTSWSCTPWSQFFYSNFFQKFLTFFTFIKFMRVYVGYLLLRVYVGYLLVFTFEGVCRVYTLRVYVGYLL